MPDCRTTDIPFLTAPDTERSVILCPASKHARRKAAYRPNEPLTPREKQVILAALRGRSRKQTADDLGVGEGAIAKHMNNLACRLALFPGVKKTYAYAALALKHKLITADDLIATVSVHRVDK